MNHLTLLSYLFIVLEVGILSVSIKATGKQQKMLTATALLCSHHWSISTPPSYSGSSYWPSPQLMHCYPVQTDSLYGVPEEVIAIF